MAHTLQDDLVSLRDKLKIEIENQQAAMRVLRAELDFNCQLYGQLESKIAGVKPPESVQELVPPDPETYTTAAAIIRDAITKTRGTQFTSDSLLASILSFYPKLNINRARISLVLWKMHKENQLIQIEKGKKGSPTIYKLPGMG